MVAILAASAIALPAAKKPESGGGGTTESRWEFVETELGRLPPEAQIVGQPFEDEHGWNFGLVLQMSSGRSLWLNGKSGPVYDDFVSAPIMDAGLVFDYNFSPDGNLLAYAVRQNGKMRMIVNGQPDVAEEAVRYPVFSANSRHLAYVIRRKGEEYVQVDGVPGPVCDAVGGPIEFSPDGRRIAYVACHGRETRMVIDQKERADWPGTGNAVFSPDGKRVAYIIKGGCVVVDGVKGPEWKADTWWGPIFSSDSLHYAYSIGTLAERSPRLSRAFIDGQPLPLPGQGTNVLHVFFSPDLKRWACTIERDGKKQVCVDGKLGPVYDSAYGLCFSGDGLRYAYQAKRGENWWMVVDGKLEAEVSLNPSSPQFSPNGKRLAYIAGVGPDWWIVVDGNASPKFKGTTRRGGVLESGDVEIPAATTPRFSPDSRHIAYAVYESGFWSVRVNGQPLGRKYERIIRGGPCFREDGTLEFLGIVDGSMHRCVASVRRTGQQR